MTFLCLVSCGKNNKSFNDAPFVKTFESVDVDQDYDGLSDELEKKLGLNPFIADLPQIEINLGDKSQLRGTFISPSEVLDHKQNILFEKNPSTFINSMRSKISLMAYHQLFNLKPIFPLSFDSLHTRQQKCLTLKDFKISFQKYKDTAKDMILDSQVLDFNYQIGFKKVTNLTSIQKLEFGLFLDDVLLSRLSSKRDYIRFDDNSFDKKEIFQESLQLLHKDDAMLEVEEGCLQTRVADFQYEIENKKLNYEKNYNNVKEANAHLVILKPGKIEKFSIHPKHYSLQSFLKNIGADPIYSNTYELQKMYGLSNDHFDENDIANSHSKDLDKSRWFFFASNHKKIYEPIEAGEIYVLANLSIRDITSHANHKRVMTGIKPSLKGELVLENMIVGDRVYLEVEAKAKFNLPANSQHKEKGYLHIAGMRFVVEYPKSCLVSTSYRLTPQDSEYSYAVTKHDLDYFVLSVGKKMMRPFLSKNKLIYQFVVEQNDLVGNQLILHFPLQTSKSYLFHQVTRRQDVGPKVFTCAKSASVKTDKTNLKELWDKKQIEYKIDMVRHGISR